jgi:hypothetical protein
MAYIANCGIRVEDYLPGAVHQFGSIAVDEEEVSHSAGGDERGEIPGTPYSFFLTDDVRLE